MPIGAISTTQRTSTSIASPTAPEERRPATLRDAGAARVIASARSNVNRTSGTMEPLAAAATGFCGRSDVSHAPNVWLCPGRDLAGRFGGAGRERRCARRWAGAQRAVARAASRPRQPRPAATTNTSSVRPPSRPIAFMSVADATPVMSSDTTSGMTVMRMAFTHSVPIGAMKSAAASSGRRSPMPKSRCRRPRRAERDAVRGCLLSCLVR